MKALTEEYQIRREAETYMIPFTRLDIPIPDQIVYSPHATTYIRADHTRIGDGYPTLTWTWDVLSRTGAYKLLSLLDGAEYANVRIRTDIRDGTNPNAASAFRLFDAIMWKPQLSGQEGIMIARSHEAYQTFVLTFKKLVEV